MAGKSPEVRLLDIVERNVEIIPVLEKACRDELDKVRRAK